MCSQSRDVPCRPPAQLGTSHILQTQNKALSPSPPPCGCLPPGLFFTSAAQIWVPSPMPISFLPRALCFSSDYSLLCRWGRKKTSASATPMLPPTQEADGAFDSSHGSTLLYLLRADLYISNTCKLSPTANRPSLLILTSEGALLYFSINSPPPPPPSPFPPRLLSPPAEGVPCSKPHATNKHNWSMQHRSHPSEMIWSIHIALSPQFLSPGPGSGCHGRRMRESHSSCSVKI